MTQEGTYSYLDIMTDDQFRDRICPLCELCAGPIRVPFFCWEKFLANKKTFMEKFIYGIVTHSNGGRGDKGHFKSLKSFRDNFCDYADSICPSSGKCNNERTRACFDTYQDQIFGLEIGTRGGMKTSRLDQDYWEGLAAAADYTHRGGNYVTVEPTVNHVGGDTIVRLGDRDFREVKNGNLIRYVPVAGQTTPVVLRKGPELTVIGSKAFRKKIKGLMK